MGGISQFLEVELLDHVFGNASYSPPAYPYLALYSAAPSKTGGGTEITGVSAPGYAREQLLHAWFADATGGTPTNKTTDTAITFDEATSAWPTVTHWGLFDASTNGNLLAWGALAVARTLASGDRLRFAIGDLDLNLDNA